MKDTITDETAEHPSATVESLKDVEHSTVSMDSYKGRPTIAFNKEGPYPFSFGVLKAKLIARHMDAIKCFAESDGKSLS